MKAFIDRVKRHRWVRTGRGCWYTILDIFGDIRKGCLGRPFIQALSLSCLFLIPAFLSDGLVKGSFPRVFNGGFLLCFRRAFVEPAKWVNLSSATERGLLAGFIFSISLPNIVSRIAYSRGISA